MYKCQAESKFGQKLTAKSLSVSVKKEDTIVNGGDINPPRDQTSSYCTIFSDQYSLVQESTEATQRYFNCLCTTLWRIT